MNFLACDGQWLVSGTHIECSGTALVVTASEIVAQQQLTADEFLQLKDYTIEILLLAFGFFAIKKLL